MQTPGRQLVENELMESLVNYLDRLEPSLSGSSFSQSGFSQSGFGQLSFSQRDYNDNFRCADKLYETQIVIELSHLKKGSQRYVIFKTV